MSWSFLSSVRSRRCKSPAFPALVLLVLTSAITAGTAASRGSVSSSTSLHIRRSLAGKRGKAVKAGTSAAPAALNITSIVEILWFFGTPYTQSYIGEGETVVWRWFDTKAHSVEGVGAAAALFTGPGTGTNVISQKNFTYKYTFAKAGSYEYQDHQYPYIMKGKVVVKPKYNFGGTTIQWFMGVSFGAASAIVQVGDTVTWEWADDVQHGVTALDGSTTMFSGRGANNDTVTGQGFQIKKKFTDPGVFLYKCSNHGTQMQGNITVLPKGSGSPSQPVAAGGKGKGKGKGKGRVQKGTKKVPRKK